MTEEIKKRIEAAKRGEVPDGYKLCESAPIPEGWDAKPLSEISEVLTEPARDREYETLSISAGIGFVNQAEKFGKELSGKQYEKYTVLREGDFAYNKGNSKKYPQGCTYQLVGKSEAAVPNVFECFRMADVEPTYYAQLFINGFMNHQLARKINHGVRDDGLLNLTEDDFFSTVLPVPPLPEQQRIAEILATCDKVIELKQKLIEELQRLKKFYMKKMFPQKGKVVPEIRFPGFTEPWEQRKFYNVFSFLQNNTLSRTELSEERGAAKNVHYGDVLMKFGEYLDVSKEQFAFIPAETVAEKFKSSFLQNGDIIIADTAEDETVGKCCEIANSAGIKIVSGLHTMPCRPNQKYASGYLGYYMNSPAYHDQLLPLMQGTKVTSVSKTAISGTVLTYPASEAEQNQISQCLLSIDNLIAHHQYNLEEEQRKKKALMQLLLTGLVRVKR